MTAALAILGSLTLVGVFAAIVRQIDREFAEVDYSPRDGGDR